MVILAGGECLTPLPPHLIVNGRLQLRQRRIHIRVDVLDAGKEAAEHTLHGRVQVVDVLLHGGLQILTAEVGRGDDRERRFQLGGNSFPVVSGRELDVPKGQEHHAGRQHRHQQEVIHDDGDARTHGKEQQGCRAQHGKAILLAGGLQDRLRFRYLTAEEAGLFAMGGLVDLIPDAFGPGGQPAEHTQREVHGRDTEDKKCAGDHADACSQQQGCQVAFTSFLGFKRACRSSLGIPFSSRRLRRLTEISFTCV